MWCWALQWKRLFRFVGDGAKYFCRLQAVEVVASMPMGNAQAS